MLVVYSEFEENQFTKINIIRYLLECFDGGLHMMEFHLFFS
jgi:hypothetical protein